MADYWVSRGKYWCLYCKIYIADDKPSRQQHENGLKHKGNVERYVRDLYKKGEQDKKDKQELEATLAKINAAAGDATPGASTSTRKAPKGPTSSNPYANYSSAQSLGLYNEEADKLIQQAEAERTQSRVGAWETVTPRLPVASTSALGAEDDDEHGRVTHKHFAKERAAPGMDDLYDPGAVAFKLKKKKKPGEPKQEEEVKPPPAAVEEEAAGENRPLKGFKLAINKSVKPEEDVKPDSPSAGLFKKKRKLSPPAAEAGAPDPSRPKVEE